MIATLKESEIDRLATLWACVRKSTLLQAITTWVTAVRADVAMKPIDVMGYKEPIHLLTAEVVKPFEMLVVKARMKITFTAGHLCCSTLAMDLKDGTPPHRLIVTSAYTIIKRGSKQYPLFCATLQGHLSTSEKGKRFLEYKP